MDGYSLCCKTRTIQTNVVQPDGQWNHCMLLWQVTMMLLKRFWWHRQTPTSATPSLGRQCSPLLPTATLRQCCGWCSMEPPGATKLTVMSSRPSVANPPSSKCTCLLPIPGLNLIYLPLPLVVAHDQLPCDCMLLCLLAKLLPPSVHSRQRLQHSCRCI